MIPEVGVERTLQKKGQSRTNLNEESENVLVNGYVKEPLYLTRMKIHRLRHVG